MKWMNRLRIMPLLVVVAALSFGVRFGEFVTGVSTMPGTANAQEEVAPAEPAQPVGNLEDVLAETAQGEGDKPPEIPPAPEVNEPNTDPMTKPDMEGGEEINWRDAEDSQLEGSEVRMELFKDLSARRKDLQTKERELSVREALLKATEQEINQKYNELVSLRSEIQELLKQQTEEEKARAASLVKIYEGMKPKDAARIFNTLDLDILLGVVSKMSERKTAPIIASMSPERARTLTIMLMEQKSLPTLSDDMVQ